MARTLVEPTTEIGRQLEKVREERGFSKDAWCTELDVSRPTYDRWLTRPTPNMDLNNMRRIGVVVGVTLDTVFDWIGIDVPIIHAPSSVPWFVRPIDIPVAA